MTNLHFGLSGHFAMRVSGGARGDVMLAEFDNLILDAGLNRLGTGAVASACQVGTGTSTPSTTDTSLQAYLVGTSTVQSDSAQSYVAGPPAYVTLSRTFRFGTGVAAGNLTEVGVGWTSATGSLFSRARIVDGGGSPATISVLSDETLDVVYTLRMYVPADVTGTVTLAGTVHNYTMRWAAVGSQPNVAGLMSYGMGTVYSTSAVWASTAALTAVTSTPTTAGTNGSVTASGYVSSSYKRSCTATMSLTQGNVGGTRCLLLLINPASGIGAVSEIQVEFSPVVPKDGTKVWTLNYEVSWGRAP